MVFGYWAIFTGVVCVIGFSYMVYAGFGEDDVDKVLDESEQENSPQ